MVIVAEALAQHRAFVQREGSEVIQSQPVFVSRDLGSFVQTTISTHVQRRGAWMKQGSAGAGQLRSAATFGESIIEVNWK